MSTRNMFKVFLLFGTLLAFTGAVTIKNKPTAGFEEDEYVNLQCEGPPGEVLEWVFSSALGDVVVSDSFPYVLNNAQMVDHSVSYLSIEGLTDVDAGIYTCRSRDDNDDSDSVTVSIGDHPPDETVEICDKEIKTIECSGDGAINVKSARLGRMTQSRCIKSDFGYIGCSTDAKKEIQDICQDKKACEVNMSDDWSRSLNKDCRDGTTSYLEITYRCDNANSASSMGAATLFIMTVSGFCAANILV